jgi:hypothetical protein
VDWVQRQYGCPVELGRIHDLLDAHPSVQWLTSGHEWAWVPDVPRSRLFRPIRQVLAVVDEIGLSDLRSAVRRDLRMEGFAPPLDVLQAIVGELPWCSVSADRLRPYNRDDVCGLTGNVGTLVDVIKQSGGVMGRYDVINACVARGMNLSTCLVLLLNSAPVIPLNQHVFALVGTQVWPSDVQRLTPPARRARVLQDFGRAGDGRLWISVRASASIVTQGLVNVPSEFEAYLQGEYLAGSESRNSTAPDSDGEGRRQYKIRVNQHLVTGLRGPLRGAGADVGDVVLIVFDPMRRIANISIGDDSVRFAYSDPCVEDTPG